ncbi:MAG: DUF86 domain-containing protein [Bacteroidetes bacterium]|nr:DUF86 domain-containing protein [Bacteroidota bacterium]
MVDAILEAPEFAEDRTRASLDHDRMLVRSLVKEIEVIGEAASNITEETRLQHISVPRDDIVGMRNQVLPPVSWSISEETARRIYLTIKGYVQRSSP